MLIYQFIQKVKFFKILFFLIITLFPFQVFSSVNNVCEKNISEIERQIDIPKGLLTAIGLTESGRYINKSKPIIWPWTINIKTKSLFFDNKKQMLKFLNSQVKEGNFDFDVGCMQVNLKWHGKYFKKISDSIDPKTNISYATSFLYKLKSDHKSWTEAIKRYHSSNPNKNVKYHKKVLANWKIQDKKTENLKISKINDDNLKLHVKNNQPKLYEKLEKIIFFRNIFMEKINN